MSGTSSFPADGVGVSDPNKLECTFCNESFGVDNDHIPRVLRCGHSICSRCLLKRESNRAIKCPICRTEHKFIEPKNTEVPTNYAVLEIIRNLSNHENKSYHMTPAPDNENESKLLCENCKASHAHIVCTDCNRGGTFYFCYNCDHSEHNRPFKPAQSHRRHPIDQVSFAAVCSSHPHKKATLFSVHEFKYACEECEKAPNWQSNSAGFYAIDEVVKKLRSHSQELNIHSREVISGLKEAKKKVKCIIEALDPSASKTKYDIQMKFGAFIDAIQKRQQELLEHVEKERAHRKQRLQEQLEMIQASLKTHQSANENLNMLISKLDLDFLCSFQDITKKMEAHLAEFDRSLQQPAVTDEIPFVIEKDIEHQLKTLKMLGTVGGGITPTDLECVASSKGNNMMQLTWQLPDGGGTMNSFEIEFEHLSDSLPFRRNQIDAKYEQQEPHIQKVPGNELNTFMDHLCPSYKYRFRIRSANVVGWGMWSKPITGRCEDFPITISYTKKINRIRIPVSGYYRITAKGAKAADGNKCSGGKGAIIAATFFLKAGDIVIVLCGGMSSSQEFSTGGGGGTFIVVNEIKHENLLIAAGGGGGTTKIDEKDYDGCNASSEPSGTDGRGKECGKGGVDGKAGEDAHTDDWMTGGSAIPKDYKKPSWGRGGAGFLQNSQSAKSFSEGGHGGQCGGFGGGGGVGRYGGGGGGGGYSGGGGGREGGGGGGGSFVHPDGREIKRSIGNDADGSVVIEKVTLSSVDDYSSGENFSSQYIKSDASILQSIKESINDSESESERSTSMNLNSHDSPLSTKAYLLSASLKPDIENILSDSVGTKGERSQPQTALSEAEKKLRARVPFLYHQQLECGSSGLKHTIDDHDITLRIPERAVAEGQNVHFEIGVAMYGPFTFPENTTPISPIIWVCIQEEIELKKKFQLILPHYLINLTKERLSYHEIEFVKANHSNLDDHGMSYQFNRCDSKPLLASSGHRSYGVLESTHCCFYCLEAKTTRELATDAGYCLVRVEKFLSRDRNEVFFSAVYFLDTCLKALEEQFRQEDGYNITQYSQFKFDADETTELCIIVGPYEQNQCVVAQEPDEAKIKAADIDFWKCGFDKMQRKHKRNMYPPRVKLTVLLSVPDGGTVILPIKFGGCSNDYQLNISLALPLAPPQSSPHSSLSVTSGSQFEHHSQTIVTAADKPELREALKELLPLAPRWATIGALLGISEDVIGKIKTDEEVADDRLRKMLSEWLKLLDPLPTWESLVNVVELIDQRKAKEIKKRTAH